MHEMTSKTSLMLAKLAGIVFLVTGVVAVLISVRP